MRSIESMGQYQKIKPCVCVFVCVCFQDYPATLEAAGNTPDKINMIWKKRAELLLSLDTSPSDRAEHCCAADCPV